MKFKFIALMCAAIFFQTSKAQTAQPEWIYVTNETVSGVSWYIKSVAESQDTIGTTIWIKKTGVSADVNHKIYNNSMALVLQRYDCTRKRMLTIRTVRYDQDGHLLNDTRSPAIWEGVVPDTAADAVMNKVCSLSN